MKYVRSRALTKDDYIMTLDECAKYLGLTKDQVHIAERSAMRKIKRMCEERGLTPENLLGIVRSVQT